MFSLSAKLPVAPSAALKVDNEIENIVLQVCTPDVEG